MYSAMNFPLFVNMFFNPVFKSFQFFLKFVVLAVGQAYLRVALDLFFYQVSATRALASHMLETSGTFLSFIEQFAFPAEIQAAMGKTFLCLQNVVHRNPALETIMSLVVANKNIVAFIEVVHF